MIKLSYLILLLISAQGFESKTLAQSIDCSECIISARYGETQETINSCSLYIQKYPSSRSTPVAQFILGRAYMELGEYIKAEAILEGIQTENSLLKAFILGLQGDSKLQRGKTEKGITLYEKAIISEYNNLTTPVYLLKAFYASNSIHKPTKAQAYLVAIRDNFPQFYYGNQLDLYLIQNKIPNAFELTNSTDEFKDEEMGIGVINGKPVNIDAFYRALNSAQENANLIAESMFQPYKEVDLNLVWSDFVINTLLDKECYELGLLVREEELRNYLFGLNGFPVLPELESVFRDENTGLFNRDELEATIHALENSTDPSDQERWKASKTYYEQRLLREKYAITMEQGVYITDLEINQEIANENELRTISYLYFPYDSIPDESINYSEEDLKNYYQIHKTDKRYETKVDSRVISFFDIPIAPSAKDSLQFFTEMKVLKNAFSKTSNDSLFVMEHSNFKLFSSTHLATFMPENDPFARQGATYPTSMIKAFQNAKIGDIIGPYEENGSYRLAKILDFNTQRLSVRHILIAASKNNTYEVAQAKVKTEQLIKEITHENFDEYVKMYSDDPGSKNSGGVYNDFMDFVMVPEFSKFSVEEPIGKIGYVQTDYGFHIMEVLERKPVKYPVLAIVEKTMTTTEKDTEQLKTIAERMTQQLTDSISKCSVDLKAEFFRDFASRAGFFSRTLSIEDNNPNLYGFNNSDAEDTIYRYAFNSKQNLANAQAICIRDSSRFVILMLTALNKKGIPEYNLVKHALKKELINERKNKLLQLQLSQFGTLEKIAMNLDMTIEHATINRAIPILSGIRYEPSVVSSVFSADSIGMLKTPIIGNGGVFYIQIQSKTNSNMAVNASEIRQILISNQLSEFDLSLKNALINRANPINNVRLFFINARK